MDLEPVEVDHIDDDGARGCAAVLLSLLVLAAVVVAVIVLVTR